jgi:uncharacterized protein (TIGR00251 family)
MPRDEHGPARPAGSVELTETGGRVRFWVRVKVRASKSRVVRIAEGKLEVAVAAPPVDGAANEELVRALAAALGVAKTRIEIAAGAASRNKLVSIGGLTAADVQMRLVAML